MGAYGESFPSKESNTVSDMMRRKSKIDFDNLNVISFSHFVPHKELLPEKRFLLDSHLPKVVGSDVLGAQLKKLQPNLHIFGHTHIPIDIYLSNVRYLQWPLGSKNERQLQCDIIDSHGPLCVYTSSLADSKSEKSRNKRKKYAVPSDNLSLSSDTEEETKDLSFTEMVCTKWGEYYSQNVRDPTNMELAPWVKAYYKALTVRNIF